MRWSERAPWLLRLRCSRIQELSLTADYSDIADEIKKLEGVRRTSALGGFSHHPIPLTHKTEVIGSSLGRPKNSGDGSTESRPTKCRSRSAGRATLRGAVEMERPSALRFDRRAGLRLWPVQFRAGAPSWHLLRLQFIGNHFDDLVPSRFAFCLPILVVGSLAVLASEGVR